jgi:MaoC dehydratase-like protein
MTETGATSDGGLPTLRELLERSIGQVVGRSVVVVERGPVATFADAIGDPNPVYRVPAHAKTHGFTSLPAPPTFPAVMEHWGRFPELQDQSHGTSALVKLLGQLLAEGGSILLAGQEFTYERPVVVGDVLVGEWGIVDGRIKRVMGSTLTFVVIEATWTDQTDGEPVVIARSTLLHRQ